MEKGKTKKEFLEAELTRFQKMAARRLEIIKDMSCYLDDLSEVLGVAKPTTPAEGISAVWKVLAAIQELQRVNGNHKAGWDAIVCEKHQNVGDLHAQHQDLGGGCLFCKCQRLSKEVEEHVAMWCVHIEGPDDILGMPSKDFAERVAVKLNKGFNELNGDDLHVEAKVIPYPYTKEGFDKALDSWADLVAGDWG